MVDSQNKHIDTKSYISDEMQVGKAGEYLVCCDLICQGKVAFLSEQGLHYDVIIDIDGKLKTMQVKTSQSLFIDSTKIPKVRFGLRRCKSNKHPYGYNNSGDVDYFAFVFLPERKIAYFKREDILSKNGFYKQCIEFKLETFKYKTKNGRYIEQYAKFTE